MEVTVHKIIVHLACFLHIFFFLFSVRTNSRSQCPYQFSSSHQKSGQKCQIKSDLEVFSCGCRIVLVDCYSEQQLRKKSRNLRIIASLFLVIFHQKWVLIEIFYCSINSCTKNNLPIGCLPMVTMRVLIPVLVQRCSIIGQIDIWYIFWPSFLS